MTTLPLLFLLACSGGLETYKSDDSGGKNLDPTGPGETGPIDSAVDGNTAPVADAGDDQEALVSSVVALDGSASYDADGDALDYQWEISSAPSGSAAALINASFSNPQFVPDLPGAYTVSLVVSDGAADSTADQVVITAAEANGYPVANAGSDQTVTTGDTVTLDGSGSTDAEGDSLAYVWTFSKPGGSTASLSGTTSVSPTFVADISGTYTATLTVFDGVYYSSPDEVRVYANDAGGTTTSGCGCHTNDVSGGLGTALLVGIGLLLNRRRR